MLVLPNLSVRIL